ncbi:netrin receptor UNC5C-like isoform X3 [Stylophora pistillata]|uniref:netrin receptor UNC5C-like isoform X3 n=1 Tax=Stylophora pistillata TaxID=50429 RepID=UPI000C04350F|nr:netrin receptor UNC5C-like isoform X3 [Stylophora pistillata]
MGKAEEKWISVYRTDPGPIKWEKIPNELEKNNLSNAWFTVQEDSIHIQTMTFCFWSIFFCGGTRRNRAIVFANKPNPGSDLIYLRFYTYSDNEDSRRRVENREKLYSDSSRPSKEKPFKVYDHSKKIIVRLEDLKEGWELDKTTDGEKVVCARAYGGRLRSQIPDTCAFAVKPVKGPLVNGFCCNIKFQQEDSDAKHIIYVNPGFTPVKVESLHEPCKIQVKEADPQVEGYFDSSSGVLSAAPDSYPASDSADSEVTNTTVLCEDQVGLKDHKEGDCSPNSSPTVPVLKYINQVEGHFSSSGGELSAAPDSEVKIVIGNGAVGDNQLVFLREVDDETKLLQNIPVGPDETLISPVIECGPDDISLSKPLKIIVPHCLEMGEVEKEWISVYRTDPGCIKWENIPNEVEKDDLSKAWFTAKEDSIHIMTMKFCYWCIFCRGGTRRKRARVFANKPDPNCDLIYLRFYVYGDNENSRKRVEKQEKRYTETSRPSIEKPFKMYNNSKKIIVRVDDLKEGWELDTTTDGEKELLCHSFRSKDSCDFQVKPIAGGVGTEAFSCNIKFKQEGREAEHTFCVSPGFELVERPTPGQITEESSDLQVTSTPRTHLNSVAGCSTSSAPDESDTNNLEEQSKPPKEKPGLGDYRNVCSHYDIDRDTVTTDFKDHEAGPTGALLEYLAAKHPQLTIAEFASVVRETTKREDVSKLLEEYDKL